MRAGQQRQIAQAQRRACTSPPRRRHPGCDSTACSASVSLAARRDAAQARKERGHLAAKAQAGVEVRQHAQARQPFQAALRLGLFQQQVELVAQAFAGDMVEQLERHRRSARRCAPR